MAAGEQIAALFAVSQETVEANCAGIGEQESRRAFPGGANCANWILGHIVVNRQLLTVRFGEKPFLREEEAVLYARGSAPLHDGGICVSFERLLEGFKVTGEQIQQHVKVLSDEDLSSELEPNAFPVPVTPRNLCTWLGLLLFHEGYHAGQLGVVRRILGKPGAIR